MVKTESFLKCYDVAYMHLFKDYLHILDSKYLDVRSRKMQIKMLTEMLQGDPENAYYIVEKRRLEIELNCIEEYLKQ